MILAAVDDLLFSSKIRTTAKLAGVELTFARTPPEILDQARALRPALVIFDLNSTKANPIDTVTAMKRDPDLASIRTLGFVSHVHTDLIDAARGAGHRRGHGALGVRGAARRHPARAPRRARDRSRPALTTVADVRAAARRIERPGPAHAAPALAVALGGGGRRRLPEARDPPADLLLQDPRRVQRRAEAGRGRRRARPLVTASAGNHGRALAHAARAPGCRLTVYAPATAPRAKLDAIREAGAELRTCGDYDEAERPRQRARRGRQRALRLAVLAPRRHRGAGTIGLEILEDLPDVDVIVVPVGGGGLISGIAIAARGIAETVSILGVEVEASRPFTQSLAAGRIVPIDVGPTLADGLAGNLDPDTITFDIVRGWCSGIVARRRARGFEAAIAGIVREERLIAEGAGAAAPAGVLGGRIDVDGQARGGDPVGRQHRRREARTALI